jgi:NAD(P)H-hydrate epimerase
MRRPGATTWVACGPGNNGGDGLVLARHLHAWCLPVAVWMLAPAERLGGDAAANLARARAFGVRFESALAPADGDLVVDALFGTGLARALEGEAAAAVARIGAARPRCSVLSVDLPSGLDGDTGQSLGACVAADATVTLGLPKLGLALEPGRSLAGRIVVARIGIADEAPGVAIAAALWTRAEAARRLPPRPRAGHKGSFGHVLVAAGSRGKTGAAALAALGAARAGAGLVTLATPASSQPVLAAKTTEAMTAALPESDGELAPAAEKPLLELAAARDVVVLGPGLGRAEGTQALVQRVTRALAAPLVLDADALFALREDLGALAARGGATVLTPHPGEAATLLGVGAAELNRDRVAAARELARRSGAVALLKGAATVIAHPDGRVVVNPTGGPLLATGGTGDVLAGMVGGLLAQGVGAFEAAALAAFVHGAAADRLALLQGASGALASEVAAAVPETLHALALEPAREALGAREAVAFPEPG